MTQWVVKFYKDLKEDLVQRRLLEMQNRIIFSEAEQVEFISQCIILDQMINLEFDTIEDFYYEETEDVKH